VGDVEDAVGCRDGAVVEGSVDVGPVGLCGFVVWVVAGAGC
jgi:hypothetical protein